MGWSWAVWLVGVTILVSASRSQSSLSTNNSFKLDSTKDNLANCLLSISRKRHLSSTVNIRIRIQAESRFFRRKLEDTVKQFCSLSDKAVLELSSGETDAYNIHMRFYFIDSLTSLTYLIVNQRKLEKDVSAEKQYHVIILPPDIPHSERILAQIFDFCWQNSIVNVNVLVQEKDEVVTLYTYHPFTEKSCPDITPTVYNRFVNGRFEFERKMFPIKTNNFWKCPVTMIASHYPPYVVVNQNRVSGININILKTLADTMNFSLKFAVSTGSSHEIFSNGSAVGAYKMLLDGEGDVLIKACDKFNLNCLAGSNPFFIEHLRIFFKSPESFTPLEILLFPFDWFTWLGILIFCIGKWIGRSVFKRIATVPRRQYSTRWHVLAWLLSILILRSSYEGSIFNFLKNNPTRALPKSVDEAIALDYTFIVNHLDSFLLTRIPELQNKMLELNGSYLEGFDFFDRQTGRYAFILNKDIADWYESTSPMHREYSVLQEPLTKILVCAYFRKFSYLTEEFTYKLDQMTTHGHINSIRKTPEIQLAERRKKMINAKRVSLSLQQLLGPFQLLAMLILMCTCVFVMEVLSQRSRRLRIVMDLFAINLEKHLGAEVGGSSLK